MNHTKYQIKEQVYFPNNERRSRSFYVLRGRQAKEFVNFLQLCKKSWRRIFDFLPRLVVMGQDC